MPSRNASCLVLLAFAVVGSLGARLVWAQERPAGQSSFKAQLEQLFKDAGPQHQIVIDLDAGGGKTVVATLELMDDFLVIDQGTPLQKRYLVPLTQLQCVELKNTTAGPKVFTFRFSPGGRLPM